MFASVCVGVLQRRPQAELFQPRRDQSSHRTHTSVALYAPFRPRISGSDQGRLEARSAHHAPEERRVRGGRRPSPHHAETRRQRPGSVDQYFTSVRQTELQMEAELQRPNIEAKVTIPEPFRGYGGQQRVTQPAVATPLMARLGAIALATDQTRVFNLSVSSPQNAMFVPGDPLGFHQSTHEEPSIPNWATSLGLHEYNVASMELFAAFLKELDAIQEGDGTLLDHSVVMAFTDQSYARIHSVTVCRSWLPAAPAAA